jgi:hypothetical protein
MDQINADPKRKWYRLAQKKNEQQLVHGSEFESTAKPRRVEMCED